MLLVAIPLQGPTQQTFRHEMRQVYRVSGTDLDKPSLRVTVTLNRSERPCSTDAPTYLAFFGLAIPPDPHVFDVDNRLFPRIRDPGAELVLRESYIAFPTLQPFADPRLAAERAGRLALHHAGVPAAHAAGPAVALPDAPAVQRGRRHRPGSLNLNALQIRRGSEQLIAGGRVLERGVDYKINYDLGQITFLNPTALFPSGSGTVTARFEERGIFAVAPTSILGGTLGYSLRRGRVRQPDRDVPAGAVGLHPPHARVRADVQPARRRQHRPALPGGRREPVLRPAHVASR